MTDECHVHLSRLVNKLLGADNPGNELVNESPRSALKVTVRMAIGWDDIIGPFSKMTRTEQSRLIRLTIVDCLKSSTSLNYVKKLEDYMIGSK